MYLIPTDVAMTISEVRQGMIDWIEENEYDSVEMMQGSMSQQAVAEPAAYERVNYLRVLSAYAEQWRKH